jgi:hypothetical protein
MDIEEKRFILDSVIWSYTSIRSYEQCPAQFKRLYMDGETPEENAFAQWGELMHSLLERYYRGVLGIDELDGTYCAEYNDIVTAHFPFGDYRNLSEKYFDYGRDILTHFIDKFADYTVLDIENKFNIVIGAYKFTGRIDLILQDNANNIVIVDHKSKNGFKSRREVDEYARQLYLYSVYIKNTYNVFPSQLIFNMFRSKELVHIPFCEKDYENTLDWALNIIKKIYSDDEYAELPSQFYCDNLCSARRSCRKINDEEGDDDAY